MARIFGGGGNDVLAGGPGSDDVRGRDGDDILHGLGGNDFLLGGPGRDTFSGGPGNANIIGGRGFDTAVYCGPFSSYSVTPFGISHKVVDLRPGQPEGADRLWVGLGFFPTARRK